ncbi:hypothetical protein [Rubrivirga sp. IMCC45206]|uniref:hypothetical protein n=1 Tax=Rubrivirga sp. IMCC45206 TaxID=3391614 RepID=UPI00399031FE
MASLRPHLAVLIPVLLAVAACGDSVDEVDIRTQERAQELIGVIVGPNVAQTPPDCSAVRKEAGEYPCTSTIGSVPATWAVRVVHNADDGTTPDSVLVLPDFGPYSQNMEANLTLDLANNAGVDVTTIDCPAALDAQTVGETYACTASTGDVPFEVLVRLAPQTQRPILGRVLPPVRYETKIVGLLTRGYVEGTIQNAMKQRAGLDISVECPVPDAAEIQVGQTFACPFQTPSGRQRGTFDVSVLDDEANLDFGFTLQ